MKLFFAFILASFLYGLFIPHTRKLKVWFILGFGLAACIGYYFLNMI